MNEKIEVGDLASYYNGALSKHKYCIVTRIVSDDIWGYWRDTIGEAQNLKEALPEGFMPIDQVTLVKKGGNDTQTFKKGDRVMLLEAAWRFKKGDVGTVSLLYGRAGLDVIFDATDGFPWHFSSQGPKISKLIKLDELKEGIGRPDKTPTIPTATEAMWEAKDRMFRYPKELLETFHDREDVPYGESRVKLNKGVIMSVVSKVKELALSKEDKLMRKYNVVDTEGNLTSTGGELLTEILFRENKAAIIEQLTAVEKSEKKEKK